MAALKFASSHNMVAFLDKPTESDGFEQIVDFLNAHPIKYALTVNPTIYTACIEQFWATAKVKTVNGEVQIQALVDKKKVIITETSVRSDLQLEDAEGTECLPNATIFEQLTLMGYENLTQKLTFYKAFFSPQWKFLIHTILQCLSAKTTAWNEFSSTMASAVICLATNQKFNFSKYIFDNMVKNLEGGVKFLMYPRFVQVFLDKQVEGMSKHKKIYVTPSHTKKVFANMKRQGKDFSGRDTPLFPTMIVQAQEQVGEGSEIPTDSHHTPTTTQPSTSKPQKKQSRRKQRKDTEVSQPSGPTEPMADETENMESVHILPIDTMLMLEWKRKSKPPGMKRLYKVGRSAQVVSSEDEEVTLVDKTQGRNDKEMFDTGILDGEKVFTEQDVVEKEVSTAEVAIDSTTTTTTTTVDELTLAQTLIEIKAAKPKAVITAATTTITTSIKRPKARRVIVQEPSEFTATTSPSQPSQLPQAKDKGKEKMIAQKLQAQLDAELEEEEKLARQREEDANIAEWDNVQAMMDVDYELAARLQAEEQGELTIDEKSRLFVELMDKRKKNFARLRAEEQRRKPPTKAQKRNTMSTYLKNMVGYKHNQLKTKSFEDIQMLFDKEMKRVNTFKDMDTELVKGSETRIEGSSKRAGEELKSNNSKKQKLDENVEAEVDDEA
ncbi:hypothetical protein Tco_0691748 [Tanacetum coccineum]